MDRPIGLCVDIGAPKSVAGRRELHRTLEHIGRPHPNLNPSRHSFRFADAVYDSHDTTNVLRGTPSPARTIHVTLEVVTAHVTELLGMDTMDKETLSPCTVTNSLVKWVREDDNNGQRIDLWSIEQKMYMSNHLYARICTPAE